MIHAEVWTVASSRLMLAVGLSAATLALFLAVIAAGGALWAGLAPWPGIGAIVMAIAAFVLSWRQRSFLVAGLLIAAGLVGLVYGLIATDFESVEFRGPIFGIIIGLPILGLEWQRGLRLRKRKVKRQLPPS